MTSPMSEELVFQACPFCPSSWPDLSQHLDLHAELQFQCFRCIRSNIRAISPLFTSYFLLADHLRRAHALKSHQMYRDVIPPLDGRQIVCLRCESVFLARSLEAIIHHYERRHPEKGLKFELEDVSTRSYEGEFDLKCRFCSFKTNHVPKWLTHFPITYEKCANFSERQLDETQPYFIDGSELQELQDPQQTPVFSRESTPSLKGDNKQFDRTFRPNIKVTLLEDNSIENNGNGRKDNAPDYCLACDSIIPKREDMDDHLRSSEHLTRSDRLKSFHCNLCCVTYPDSNRDQFELHLQSNDHLANVEVMVTPPSQPDSPKESHSPQKRSRSQTPPFNSFRPWGFKKTKIVSETNGTLQRKYICRICNRWCPSAFNLQQHFLGKSHLMTMEQAPYRKHYLICSICFPLKLSVNIKEFFEHVRSKRHLDRLDFLNSMEQNANQIREPVPCTVPDYVPPPKDELGHFTCFFCEMPKEGTHDVLRHLVIAHPRDLFQCATCFLHCSSLKAMQLHLKHGHPRSSYGKSDMLWIPNHFYYFLCRECDPAKKFGGGNRRMVEDHLRREHGHRKADPYRLWVRCRLCCMDFKNVYVFDDHSCMRAFKGKRRVSLAALEAVIRNDSMM